MVKVKIHQRIVSFFLALVFILSAPLPGAGGMTYRSVNEAKALPAVVLGSVFGGLFVAAASAVAKFTVPIYIDSYLSSVANYIDYNASLDTNNLTSWFSDMMPGWENMSESEAYNVHNYSKMLNLLSMNQAYYDENTENPFSVPSASYFGFGNWRHIDRGNSDIWSGLSYSSTWRGFMEAPDNKLTVPKVYLADSNYLAVRFNKQDADKETSDGLPLYRYEFFSTGLFTFDDAKELSMTFPANTGAAYKDDNSPGTYNLMYTYQFYEYDGDYLEDDNILNILSNANWKPYGSVTSNVGSSIIFNADKLYVLVVGAYIHQSGYNQTNYDFRIHDYVWFYAPTLQVRYSGTLLTNESAEEVFANSSTTNNISNDLVNNYTNYYNYGNWWQGDNNGDGNVDLGGSGSGDGSGDGNISGDLNVNVDGSLDHNVSGGLDINVNLPGFNDTWFPSGSDPPDGDDSDFTLLGKIDEILSALIDFIFIKLLFGIVLESLFNILKAIVQPITDLLKGFVNNSIVAFNEAIDDDFAEAVKSIWFWLPDQVANMLTITVMFLCILAIARFFIG